jgi:hypothetical protein
MSAPASTPKNPPPRRPILTRREQVLLAFLLALLVLGGIVRKLRTEWRSDRPVAAREP